MIIFARTRWQYDSYQDFWRLVELSGFPIVYLDEIDLASDNVYIFTPHTGEFNQATGLPADPPAPGKSWHTASCPRPEWRERKCKVVWWMLERPDGGPISLADNVSMLMDNRLVDAAWVSDRWVSTLHPKLTHAVLGGHPGLRYATEPQSIVYDYAHLSYAWGRRENLYHVMRARGLREAPNGWGAIRSQILSQTRIVVSAHQYPARTIAPLRLAVAAAHHLPALSEVVNDPFPHTALDLAQATYPAFAEDAQRLLSDPGWLTGLADSLHHRLCVEWTFRRGVEDAVSRSFT
jgi:hypothetical protein